VSGGVAVFEHLAFRRLAQPAGEEFLSMFAIEHVDLESVTNAERVEAAVDLSETRSNSGATASRLAGGDRSGGMAAGSLST